MTKIKYFMIVIVWATNLQFVLADEVVPVFSAIEDMKVFDQSITQAKSREGSRPSSSQISREAQIVRDNPGQEQRVFKDSRHDLVEKRKQNLSSGNTENHGKGASQSKDVLGLEKKKAHHEKTKKK